MTSPLRSAGGPGRRGSGWFAAGARAAVVAVGAVVLGLPVWAPGSGRSPSRPGSSVLIVGRDIAGISAFT